MVVVEPAAKDVGAVPTQFVTVTVKLLVVALLSIHQLPEAVCGVGRVSALNAVFVTRNSVE
jgi:hypothetical protein